MDNQRKKRILKIGFILGGFLLLINGVVLISQTKLVYGAVHLFASILNFGMLLNFKATGLKQKLEDAIFIMNSILSMLIAIDYIQDGSNYIHYAWILSSILFLLALVYKKLKTRPTKV